MNTNSPSLNIAPVDGRYFSKNDALRPIFSEYGLCRFRIYVEIEWLKFLAAHDDISEIECFSEAQLECLDRIYQDFSIEDIEHIKKIEKKTNHDLKSVEYFIKEKLEENQLEKVLQFVHFACTSEDINNLSYALMLKKAKYDVLLPKLSALIEHIEQLAHRYADIPLLSRTHGQAASPTTLGKEFAVYAYRLNRQKQQFMITKLFGKFNGAVGNYNAHYAAYPKVDWMRLSSDFVTQLGLEWNPYTTQIESHDYISEYAHILVRINTILVDFCRDIWGYIAFDYFILEKHPDEIGSSVMPHKVNPIDFENAEGNAGLAISMLQFFAERLPVSRWQRDLSDSTILRNIGSAIAHSSMTMDSCMQGLQKLQVNQARLQQDLSMAWEVLAEPIQTVMRRYGIADSYEQLKKITRGQGCTPEKLHQFIKELAIPEDAKKALLVLRPETYIGNANVQAKDFMLGFGGYRDAPDKQNKGEIKLNSYNDNVATLITLAQQCTSSLDIIIRHIDHSIYQKNDFIEALKNIALRGKKSKIRLLLFETSKAVTYNQRLLNLARDLSSFIETRQIAEEHQGFDQIIATADKKAYLFRESSERYQGVANFNDPARTRHLQRQFNSMWLKALANQHLSRLYL